MILKMIFMMVITTTTASSYTSISAGVAPLPSPSSNNHHPPFCCEDNEDDLRKTEPDLWAFPVVAPRAQSLLVKTYLSRSVQCQIDKHHIVNQQNISSSMWASISLIIVGGVYGRTCPCGSYFSFSRFSLVQKWLSSNKDKEFINN